MLDDQKPVYAVSGQSIFEVAGATLQLREGRTVAPGQTYDVTVNATGSFGTANSHTITVHAAPDPFVTTWETEAANQTITINVGNSINSYDIDWGDGTAQTGVTGNKTHTYASAGRYTVTIGGEFDRFNLGGTSSSNKARLDSIDQWGSARWTSMKDAFRGASNMAYNAADAPDLSGVADMSGMFNGATSFNGDLSSWNVSQATDMSRMFNDARSFNGDLSSWNVSQATDMSRMFNDARSFNGDLSSWNVSQATDMSRMFNDARSFNGDLSSWNVSQATDMSHMFNSAIRFNGDLSSWDVSQVTDMSGMFRGSLTNPHSFNGDLSSWNVSQVADMSRMFRFATSFNGDLSSWDVSQVTDMTDMFLRATSFNGDLSSWNVSQVTDMTSMFAGASLFNGNLSAWDVSQVTDMSGMFAGAASFHQNLGRWYIVLDADLPTVSNINRTVGSISAQNQVLDYQKPVYAVSGQSIFEVAGATLQLREGRTVAPGQTYDVTVNATGSFGTANSRTITVHAESIPDSGAFVTTWETEAANQTITINVGNSTNSYDIDWGDGTGQTGVTGNKTHTYAFAGRYTVTIGGEFDRFNLGGTSSSNKARLASIDQWGSARWTSMKDAFRGASNMAYNAADAPDLSGVADMSGMFLRATSFNGDLSSWDVSQATDMSDMFHFAAAFNGDLSSWNVSAVTDMSRMFNDARSFNGDLSSWNVSQATDMSGMFADATSFNGDLSSWDVSQVTDMSDMFRFATSFNGDLSSWDVSAVTDMSWMFIFASSFNQDLSSWDVSQATDMSRMFAGASLFNGNLSSWDVSQVTDMSDMFADAASFHQNLGRWYIVLDADLPTVSNINRTVGSISAQNQVLDDQKPVYAVSGQSIFEVAGATLQLREGRTVAPGQTYDVTVNATGSFGTANSRTITVHAAPDSFVTTWETEAANQTITINVGNSINSYDIDWGDGTGQTGVTGNKTHTYASAGRYTVAIGGEFDRFNLGGTSSSNKARLASIDQWGSARWTSMKDAFRGASNMAYNAADAPDLSGVADMSRMFAGASLFNGDLSSWNVSQATDMSDMFHFAAAFNGNLSSWDVSQATDMSDMFTGAASFHQNLGRWYIVLDADLPTVSNSNRTVGSISAQNQVLDDQKPVYAVSGQSIFEVAGATLQLREGRTVAPGQTYDVTVNATGSFGTANSRTITVHAAPDPFVTTWETEAANQTITINVGNSINSYDIDWGDGTGQTGVTGNKTHTYASAGRYTVAIGGEFDRFNLGGTSSSNKARLASIDQWGSARWTSMKDAFRGASNMAYNAADAPDLSGVADMSGMFAGASLFNGDLSSWNVSQATDMSGMFHFAAAFNGNLSSWDVSQATDMSDMFTGAASFHQNLGRWYIVLDADLPTVSNINRTVGSISTQNQVLDDQKPVYAVSGQSIFEVAGATLQLREGRTVAPGQTYDVTVNATGSFGTANSRTITVHAAPDPFVTTWETEAANQTITINVGNSINSYDIDWGDGTAQTGVTGNKTHTYASAGRYTVAIGGEFDRFNLGGTSSSNKARLASIDQWGSARWTSMKDAFRGASNMAYNAADAPDLSGVADMSGMFLRATSFNGDLSSWDVSQVTDMSGMFHFATSFNGDLSSWDVSQVTDMSGMFLRATSFNGDLSSWDVSQVTDMSGMFHFATSFNGDLSSWDVSQVTDMSGMFRTTSFNGDLSSWDVSQVTDMSQMFAGAIRFNGDLSSWDVSQVTDMSQMFAGTRSFNGDLSSWNVSQVTDMSSMFVGAASFHQNLGRWYIVLDADLPTVSNSNRTVGSISAQNQVLDDQKPVYAVSGQSIFEVAGATLQLREGRTVAPGQTYDVTVNATGSFGTANSRTITVHAESIPDSGAFVTTWETEAANQTITINVGNSTNSYDIDWGDGTGQTGVTGNKTHTYASADWYTVTIGGEFDRFNLGGTSSSNKARLASIDQWGSARWTSMKDAFRGASNMAYNAADAPDLSGVADMSGMFAGASLFNGNLSSWNVSQVTDMSSLFNGASLFNGDLSSWNVSQVTDMSYMFRTTTFNGDLSSWDVSQATDMSGMFADATSFNGDLSSWNVSQVTDMSHMFAGATSFNGDLSSWNVSQVTDMSHMFAGATSFNGDLSSWDVSQATDMSRMFAGASLFNGNLSSWDVSQATDMSDMFAGAASFHQNLGRWYIVLDADLPTVSNSNRTVGSISAQNQVLDDQKPVYAVSGQSIFEVAGATLQLREGRTVAPGQTYDVTVNATGSFGTANSRTITVHAESIPDSGAFVTTWETEAANQTITINVGNSTNSYDIDWGDGTAQTGVTGNKTHTYASADWYTVTIGGEFDRFNLGGTSSSNKARLASIDQWGSARWTSMKDAFRGASNMAYNAADAPDLSGVADMSGMFNGATSFNGDLSSWDVSQVTDMSGMFAGASLFNGDVSVWDVSAVTDMSDMFAGASLFNGDVSVWDVSAVTDMSDMFAGASLFNGDVSSWDVSAVTDMSWMFIFASSFNQDLSSWDVSAVTDMSRMFAGASLFNGNLSSWDVSQVTDMSDMFAGAASFHQNLGRWYIVLDADLPTVSNSNRTVGSISAQNQVLDDQKPVYAVSGQSIFEVAGATLQLREGRTVAPGQTYDVTVNATGSFGTANSRTITVHAESIPDSGAFVTTWETEAANQTITINVGNSTNSYDIDWGDGTAQTGVTGNKTHTYAFAGRYTVTIGGEFDRFNLGGTSSSNKARLDSIDQWGSARWTSMKDAFRGASNMAYNAADAPDLSGVADMSGMFNGATSFNGDLSSWDVSQATDMSDMFHFAAAFNGDLSSWNVSAVTDMSGMFNDATSFNGDLSSWDVSQATDMSGMFADATSFNGDLSSWDVSAVTDMSDMFRFATSFNGNLSSWDVSAVTDMSWMFIFASSFNQDLSSWNVSQATDMSDMFTGAASFHQNLGRWYIVLDADLPTVSNSNRTVGSISAQNQVLDDQKPVYAVSGQSIFEVAGATLQLREGRTVAPGQTYDVTVNATGSFGTANSRTITVHAESIPDSGAFVTTWETEAANQTITINVGNSTNSYDIDWGDGTGQTGVTGNKTHTYASADWYTVTIGGEFDRFNLGGTSSSNKARLASIDQWGSARWTSMKDAFRGASNMAYNAADAPDLSGVADMSRMFAGASLFNGDLSSWNVSQVTDMSGMFRTTSFNGNLSSWDVSQATDMSDMFTGASLFNGNLSSWDVSQVTDMSGMFLRATSFNGDLSSWDVSQATDMSGMFNDATSFNGDLSSWDVSQATDMSDMFHFAAAFNGDLSSWNVSQATDMSGMFNDATSFNGDLSSWDVSQATDMSGMFNDATSFNGDLSSWDVSQATDMSGMFADATSFNGDLSSWDVSAVTDMSDMFRFATSFNGNLSSWDVSAVTDMSWMFIFASSFNQDLSSWNVSQATDMSDMFTGAASFHQNLGRWYIVLDADLPTVSNSNRTVGSISAQNQVLDDQKPVYAVSGQSIFEVAGATLQLREGRTVAPGQTYDVTVNATGSFGTANSRTITVHAESIPDSGAFVTTWETEAANQTITINVGNSTNSYDIDWGDGTGQTGVTGNKTHTYASADWYTVTIGGEFDRFNLGGTSSSNKARLASIDQWGSARWTSMKDAFRGASNMAYNAADAPDLSGVADMSGMFAGASLFNGDLSSWDVSAVTDMSDMFAGASLFNGDVSSWDVSAVTDMSWMFIFASSFNQDLSSWDVSAVTDMSRMFAGASLFNGNLSSWDVSQVTDMSDMFADAASFHQNLGRWYIVLDADLPTVSNSNRTVGSISAQNQVLDDQKPVYAVSGQSIFEVAGATLQLREGRTVAPGQTYDVTVNATGSFGTANSRTITVHAESIPDSGAFVTTWETEAANQTITINVGNSTNSYDIDWGDGTGQTGVTGNKTHTYASAGRYTVAIGGEFDRFNLGGTSSGNKARLASIDQWGSARWTSMRDAFHGASNMAYNAADAPDLSGVADMSGMFAGATSFNGNLSSWNVSQVTDMSGMFSGASLFNGPLLLGRLAGHRHVRHVRRRRIIPPEPRQVVHSARHGPADGIQHQPDSRLHIRPKPGARRPETGLRGVRPVNLRGRRRHPPAKGGPDGRPRPDVRRDRQRHGLLWNWQQPHHHGARRIHSRLRLCHHLGDRGRQPDYHHQRRQLDQFIRHRLGRRHRPDRRHRQQDPHVRLCGPVHGRHRRRI